MKQKIKVALSGQPNVGKSSLINSISNARLHVGNFSGVTVEKKEVFVEHDEYDIEIVDLPGIYSFHSYTPDEDVAKEYLINEHYDLLVNVVDAHVLARNLNFTLQILDMQKKSILIINMIDEIEDIGGKITKEEIEKLLGIPVILTSALKQVGVNEIIDTVIKVHNNPKPKNKLFYNEKIESAIAQITKILRKSPHFKDNNISTRFIAIRLLDRDEDIYKSVNALPIFIELQQLLARLYQELEDEFDEESSSDVLSFERNSISKSLTKSSITLPPSQQSLTDKIDKVLIHPIMGMPIFLFFMWAVFQLTFTLGAVPMEYIDETFGYLSRLSATLLPEGNVNSAISDGVIPAVGAIIMFLPNILILFLGINLLEQTGYMARAAFLMDGMLKKFGLQGKAFIPLVSGFGCSVPAYMAARTLKNPKDRLITMLVIGFMSCGAKLPVYVLLISAFFEPSVAGNILFVIYIGGALLGLIVAKILRIVLFKGEPEPFVMEIPPYRFPSFKSLAIELWIKAKMFIKKAGTFIALASLAIWFLSVYPKASIDESLPQSVQNEQQLESSYLGQMGKSIEPIFAPLGFDWKLSVAVITGLSAKEVVVSTLATLYSVGGASEEDEKLLDKIKENIDIKTALALIVLVMVYSPCLAAMSTFYSEIPQWAWRAFYFIYPNLLAWLLAFATYSFLSLLGL